MLLQKLNEYADRLDLPPRLYTNAPVRYVIELDGKGNFLALTDTAGTDRTTKRGVPHLVPQTVRAVGIKPFLLADKADYVLGFVSQGGKPARVAACHAAFRDLLGRCAAAVADSRVAAVATFLAADPLSCLGISDTFDPSAAITFRVDDEFVVDLPAVRRFWADQNDAGARDAANMQCLICGRQKPVLERLELKVKGVPGGQMSGTSIISFNAPAFESYHLRASLNAPTCESCGERSTRSLNDMLRDPASHIRVGGVAYVFWTREPKAKFSFATFITEPTSELVKQLYTSAARGREGALTALDDEEMSRFYATALSGSGGRAVVRDWIDTSIAEAKAHLAQWFRLQEIVPQFGEYAPLNIRQLAYATVRTGDRNNPPPANVTRSLLRSALTGSPIPWQLLFEAVRRNRAEQSVTRPRAALIKMVLLSQRPTHGEEVMVQLDTTKTNTAYRCGRLLAVIESIQRAAMPGVNATIVDRFYGTASSAPASVFGRLMRGAQPHLSKLERDRRGAWVALQRQLEDVLSGLPLFPKTLTLEEQGLFALGYYHERARRWGGKGARSNDDANDAAAGDEADETMELGDEQEGAPRS